MADNDPSDQRPEPTWPNPPRFWWLKRLSVAGGALLVALIILRLGWGWEAQRRLRAAVAGLRAEGHPVRVEDLAAAPLDDEENAAQYLKRAHAFVIRSWAPSSTSLTFPAAYTPYSPKWHEVAAAAVKTNGQAYPLARHARAYDRSVWVKPARPYVSTTLPHLGPMKALCNDLGDAALFAHEQGEDAAALETIRDLRHLAEQVGAQPPMIVCNLVQVGMDAVAMARLQEIAPGLRIVPGDAPARPRPTAAGEAPGPFPSTAPTDPPRGVTRGHVRTLIAELLDDRARAKSLRDGIGGERLWQLESAEVLATASVVLTPMYRLDAVRMSAVDDAVLDAAARPTWPQAKAALDATQRRVLAPLPPSGFMFAPAVAATPPPRRQPIDYSRMLSWYFLSGGIVSGRFVEQNMRSVAERRMVAVTLAAQLYRADNGGAWPPSLDALVPHYLPGIPRDPLSLDDRPLGYLLMRGGLPDGGDRPAVYSAGRNGVIDTRGLASVPDEPFYSWMRGPDEYRDLARWRPAPPSTQPTANCE